MQEMSSRPPRIRERKEQALTGSPDEARRRTAIDSACLYVEVRGMSLIAKIIRIFTGRREPEEENARADEQDPR